MSTSANPPSDPNYWTKALTELGAAGTLTTVASQVSAMGIGQVALATVAGAGVTVSLPAVVAVGAAGYLGISLGKKIVDAINS